MLPSQQGVIVAITYAVSTSVRPLNDLQILTTAVRDAGEHTHCIGTHRCTAFLSSHAPLRHLWLATHRFSSSCYTMFLGSCCALSVQPPGGPLGRPHTPYTAGSFDDFGWSLSHVLSSSPPVFGVVAPDALELSRSGFSKWATVLLGTNWTFFSPSYCSLLLTSPVSIVPEPWRTSHSASTL